MGKRLNRTILNWRWWLVLPFIPVVVCLIALQWLFRLPLMALDTAEQGSREVFNWVRHGYRPRTVAPPPAPEGE